MINKVELESVGFVRGAVWGGIPKQKYYTPDGRVIEAIPALREYVKKNREGKIVETGTRDANLDRGWLLSPPKELELSCSGCGKWHKTQAEVNACVKSREELLHQYEPTESPKVNERMDKLEAMMALILEKLDKEVRHR